jgi:hypothetical protein
VDEGALGPLGAASGVCGVVGVSPPVRVRANDRPVSPTTTMPATSQKKAGR